MQPAHVHEREVLALNGCSMTCWAAGKSNMKALHSGYSFCRRCSLLLWGQVMNTNKHICFSSRVETAKFPMFHRCHTGSYTWPGTLCSVSHGMQSLYCANASGSWFRRQRQEDLCKFEVNLVYRTIVDHPKLLSLRAVSSCFIILLVWNERFAPLLPGFYDKVVWLLGIKMCIIVALSGRLARVAGVLFWSLGKIYLLKYKRNAST